MLSRAAIRSTTQVAGRRGFHATRSQMSSPYHYSDGPYSNIPFNPKKKTFPILFWSYCAIGFGAPFAIASASRRLKNAVGDSLTLCSNSLANVQAQGISCICTSDRNGLAGHDRLEHQGNRGAAGLVRLDLTLDIQQSTLFFVLLVICSASRNTDFFMGKIWISDDQKRGYSSDLIPT